MLAADICSRIEACLQWVKVRRTQYEYMFSAFLSNSDIARCSRHVSNVPKNEPALAGRRGGELGRVASNAVTI